VLVKITNNSLAIPTPFYWPKYRWDLYLNQQFRDKFKVEFKRVSQTEHEHFGFSKRSPLRGTYFP